MCFIDGKRAQSILISRSYNSVYADYMQLIHKPKDSCHNVFITTSIVLIVYLVALLSGSAAVANGSLTLSGSDSAMDHYIFSNILKPAYSTLSINTEFAPLPSSRSLVNANRGITDGEIARIEDINRQYKNLIRVPIAIMTPGVYALSLSKLPIKNWKDVSKYNEAYRAVFRSLKMN